MTLADYPSIRQHDVKDFLYDVAIDDMQRQSCYKIREQYQLGELWQLQRTNLLKGVGDVKLSQLYQGEGSSKSDKDMLEDRQSNAGELTDADSPTTLFDVHRGHIRVPINDESGKWDSDSELPHWYEYWFVGDINANPKCVRLAPHWDDEIPVDVIHSHDDDKGGIHMMYVNLVKSYMAQEMTSIDQYFDNVTERNQAPWIMEPGAVRIRSFLSTASHNRVWVKKPGVPIPEIVDVQDTTLQTSTMIGFIQEQINKAMGTNKPFLGEALGSRTSASEAITDFEQALKPALRDAAYKSGQLLPFYAKWVDRMTELFADPNTVVLITYNGQTQELKPAELCGPMRYRVVSIKKFQDNAIRERQEVQFMSQYFAIAAPLMGKLAQIPLKQIAVNRQYEHVETWFPKLAADKDAQNVAKSENQQITLEGVIDQPDKDENHEAHLAKHEPYLASINIMTTEQQEQIGATDQNIANLKLHIQTHETMMAEEAQSAQAAGSAAQGAAPAEPTLPGEQAGDDLAAAAGAEAIGGRPPDIEGAGLI